MPPARVAYFGNPDSAVPILKSLAESCTVNAVFCNPDRPQGRGRLVAPPPVKQAALGLGLEVYQPESWKSETTRLLWDSLNVDLAVVAAYGQMLPSWMLESCRLGAWNLHFSLLPRWRGAAPVNHAIMAGDEETGVSLMKIVPALDAGPVLAQCRRPISMDSTAGGLLATLAEDAAAMLRASIDAILRGRTDIVPQDGSLATLAPKLTKDMAKLDLTKSAINIHRQIRGLQPWPGAEFQFDGATIKVLETNGISHSSAPPGTLLWGKSGVWLSAGDNNSVELITLQRPGKPSQPARQAMQFWGPSGCKALGVCL